MNELAIEEQMRHKSPEQNYPNKATNRNSVLLLVSYSTTRKLIVLLHDDHLVRTHFE